jgi:hypothetical protein
MANNSQNLRRSQFITTYGPGSILEGPEGPKIIPSIDISNIFNSRRPEDFEIFDRSLSHALLGDAGIVRLPSNAELGESDGKWIYNTKRFPSWSLCTRHKILYRKTQSDNIACFRCDPHPNSGEAWSQANRQAVRFIRACPEGHLDDVDWVGLVHQNNQACSPTHLIWSGGGGALRNVNIKCPNCSQSLNLGVAYARTLKCSGRFPERETSGPPLRTACNADAKILQRGAANLRIPEIQSALTIPPRSSQLHRLLEIYAVQVALAITPPTNKKIFLELLGNLATRNLISQSIVNEFQAADERVLMSAISDTVTSNLPADLHTLRSEEFRALKEAATFGHPPQPSSQPGGPPQFEIVQSQVRKIASQAGREFRVTPVNRLRVVMVQTGYRRVPGGDPADSAVVSTAFPLNSRTWFPGVELFGEGIFIDLDVENNPQNSLSLSGDVHNTWQAAWQNPQNFVTNNLMGNDRNQLHPVFVWWHTLAHRLINALAVDSGYSSAAIRERVFIDVDDISGQASGGILLYTAQPGGDGTLGGLIALVPEFERVLLGALRNLDACSNDPLCSEERFSRGKYNGAACYACSLISETSCEHRNMRLDRNLLIQNLP